MMMRGRGKMRGRRGRRRRREKRERKRRGKRRRRRRRGRERRRLPKTSIPAASTPTPTPTPERGRQQRREAVPDDNHVSDAGAAQIDREDQPQGYGEFFPQGSADELAVRMRLVALRELGDDVPVVFLKWNWEGERVRKKTERGGSRRELKS